VTSPSPQVGIAPAASERFPGPTDFAEGYATQPDPVFDGLQSMYTGTVAVTMMDRTAVAKVLAPGFRLASPISPSTRHPVIHLIGDQLEPRAVLHGYVGPVLGPGYQEMILLVPYVVRDSGSGMHTFAVRMYLTDPTAVAGGNEFGYAKELAKFHRVDADPRTTYQVTTWDGATTWFVDEIDRTGQWTQPPAYPPRWLELREIFRMPILGLRPPDPLRPPQFMCSYWEWDFAEAELATATSRHRFVTRFVDGADDWVAAGPLASAPDGAVAMRRVRWRLATPPTPC
jgi:hypothetical protein